MDAKDLKTISILDYYILIQTNTHFYIIYIVVRRTLLIDFYAVNVGMLQRNERRTKRRNGKLRKNIKRHKKDDGSKKRNKREKTKKKLDQFKQEQI